MSDALSQLDVLRAELAHDLMLCTTRDAHIRLTTRIIQLDSTIKQLRESVQVELT